MDRNRIRRGVALGLVLALASSVGSAVGFSSHPVGEESHPILVFNPRPKKCTGDPPRQTEDPLSPPCVPLFDGENGGATARGVTAHEVRIVLYNDLGLEGDMTLPYRPDDESAGHEASTNGEQRYLVRSVKMLWRWFQHRYQTYDRTVRIIAVASGGGVSSSCGSRKVEASVIQRDWRPFAVTTLGDNMDCFVDEMRSHGIPTYGAGRDLTELADDGMVWTFHPSLEDETHASAAYLCDKLVGRPARYARDPMLQATDRRFALLYPRDSERGPTSAQAAASLMDRLGERCGLVPGEGADQLLVRPYLDGGQAEALSTMLDLQRRGITTVICYCVAVQPELTVSTYQSTATMLRYFPEWYWDTTSRMFRSAWHRNHGSSVQVSFGITPDRHGGALEERYPSRAYRSMYPGTEPNERFVDDIYHSFLVLFNAVQLAGPELTVEHAATGLRTSSLRTGDPRYADGGHEAEKGDDRGAFRDRYLSWWWDPSGREPGRYPNDGCLRSSLEIGSAAGWLAGDDDVVGDGTCLGSTMDVPTSAESLLGAVQPLPRLP